MDLTSLALATGLFRGLAPAEAEDVLYRLNAVKKTFRKGETVVHAGLEARRLFAVVSGHLRVYERVKGDRVVLVREIAAGEMLGLWILHVPEVVCWPGTVVAAADATLISLDLARARALQDTGGPAIGRLALNTSRLLSRELFSTWRKLAIMDGATIEERLEIYLAELDHESGDTGEVTVPFDRERMAEYFGVTRPALSRALGHMRDRGLLSWRKNAFRLDFRARGEAT